MKKFFSIQILLTFAAFNMLADAGAVHGKEKMSVGQNGGTELLLVDVTRPEDIKAGNRLHLLEVEFRTSGDIRNVCPWRFSRGAISHKSPVADKIMVEMMNCNKEKIKSPRDLANAELRVLYTFSERNSGGAKSQVLKMADLSNEMLEAFFVGGNRFRLDASKDSLGELKITMLKKQQKGTVKFTMGEYKDSDFKGAQLPHVQIVVAEQPGHGPCKTEILRNDDRTFTVNWAKCYGEIEDAEELRNMEIQLYFTFDFDKNSYMWRNVVSFAQFAPEFLEQLYGGGEAKIEGNPDGLHAVPAVHFVKGPSASKVGALRSFFEGMVKGVKN